LRYQNQVENLKVQYFESKEVWATSIETHPRRLSSVQKYRHVSNKKAANRLVFEDVEYSLGSVKDPDFAEFSTNFAHDGFLTELLC
jgi:hypothetical protein